MGHLPNPRVSFKYPPKEEPLIGSSNQCSVCALQVQQKCNRWELVQKDAHDLRLEISAAFPARACGALKMNLLS